MIELLAPRLDRNGCRIASRHWFSGIWPSVLAAFGSFLTGAPGIARASVGLKAPAAPVSDR
jgi:hypothetical protein